jgi:hypothetical protein
MCAALARWASCRAPGDSEERAGAREDRESAQEHLPARVPQPHRRDHHLLAAQHGADESQIVMLQMKEVQERLSEHGLNVELTPPRAGLAGPGRLRPGLWRPPAAPRLAEARRKPAVDPPAERRVLQGRCHYRRCGRGHQQARFPHRSLSGPRRKPGLGRGVTVNIVRSRNWLGSCMLSSQFFHLFDRDVYPSMDDECPRIREV